MSYRLHFLALAVQAASANLCFDEDFSVVAGQTDNGDLVLPTCENTSYICAGGILGLPYLPQLGHQGARLDFFFPQPVSAVLVATTSTQKPIAQAIYTEVEKPTLILGVQGVYDYQPSSTLGAGWILRAVQLSVGVQGGAHQDVAFYNATGQKIYDSEAAVQREIAAHFVPGTLYQGENGYEGYNTGQV
jgi:hypothetical protein